MSIKNMVAKVFGIGSKDLPRQYAPKTAVERTYRREAMVATYQNRDKASLAAKVVELLNTDDYAEGFCAVILEALENGMKLDLDYTSDKGARGRRFVTLVTPVWLSSTGQLCFKGLAENVDSNTGEVHPYKDAITDARIAVTFKVTNINSVKLTEKTVDLMDIFNRDHMDPNTETVRWPSEAIACASGMPGIVPVGSVEAKNPNFVLGQPKAEIVF